MASLEVAQAPPAANDEIEKQPAGTASVAESYDAEGFAEKPAPLEEAQEGVRSVEAITLTWTKQSLALAFIWYVNLLWQEGIANKWQHVYALLRERLPVFCGEYSHAVHH